eukprot:TRINITY_DN2732_c0_g1_i2.p1 TRINITY_DN2732_c0_g1~~TRINITY_DN2732_c0_g1_i2.p1  ORF type:complete len:587 (+),score=138.31 TRINITY_DN2732_c0_g1_i2:156-1916(+)
MSGGSSSSSSGASGSGGGDDKIFENAIAELLVPLLPKLTFEQLVESIEVPRSKENGDYALPVARLNRYSKLEGKPNEIAAQLAAGVKPNDVVLSANSTGPYLNFRINKQILINRVLKQVFEQGENYGSTNEGAGKTIVVEFSSPNIAKPFHAGHLRSTIIGNFLKHIFRSRGYNVVAINYLGDWGKQYGLLAIGFERYGSEAELLQNPIRHLFDVYVKINKAAEEDPTIHDNARAYFKRMEDGEPEALKLWDKFRTLSIEEYRKIYKRLNVEFDVYSGESLMTKGMHQAFRILEEKKLLEDNKGAQVVNLSEEKLGLALVRKSDGATLYITRDIAAAAGRKEQYNFDQMYYVVAAQQDLHFQQLFRILDKMGYDWFKSCHHINFGMVLGMSTRRGNVVFLEDILSEAKQTMLEVMKKNEAKFAEIENPEAVADIVGISAVIVQDFGAKRIKDYSLSWERMTSFEGDTGPYLQYAHARLCSMERKSGVKVNPNANFNLLTEPEAHDIATQISKYPEVLKAAALQLEPCVIVAYLFQLAHSISVGHSVLWVKDREIDIAEARMALFWAARVTLGSALKILGIIPLERM